MEQCCRWMELRQQQPDLQVGREVRHCGDRRAGRVSLPKGGKMTEVGPSSSCRSGSSGCYMVCVHAVVASAQPTGSVSRRWLQLTGCAQLSSLLFAFPLIYHQCKTTLLTSSVFTFFPLSGEQLSCIWSQFSSNSHLILCLQRLNKMDFCGEKEVMTGSAPNQKMEEEKAARLSTVGSDVVFLMSRLPAIAVCHNALAVPHSEQ